MSLTRRGKAVATLVVLFLLLGIPAAVGVVYLNSIGVTSSSSPGEPVEVEIPEGTTMTEVGEILEAEGVIKSAQGFRFVSFLGGGDEGIQAGTYELSTGLSARDALDRMLEGPEVRFITVTFPEGAWLPEFAERLDEDTSIRGRDFLRVLESGEVKSSILPKDSNNFEGLLFPSTYQVVEEDTAQTLAQRLVDETEKQLAKVDTSRVEAMGYSKYEILNVASMIQAEAGVSRDRGKIARVIYNRLDENIALGIDATVIYALGERKNSLTSSDLEIDSPFNTRKVAGLPPTPIGAPGAEAIEAAAKPVEGPWLYYVLSDCDGKHAFSVDYEDFLADKADYQNLTC
ncbi:MAG: endolytic transglycosylase MltG [Actinobacteria bacterium]|nr:endolytic transglycosylase MltG [Actinomycetota bacterium]